jgi:hypothetical protein
VRDVTKARFSIRLVPIRDWQWPCSVPSPTCRAICLDRILQSVSPPAGNNGNAEAFAPHAKTSASFDLGNSDGIQRGNRAGSAFTIDATGSNGPASAREECDGLRADAINAATRHHRAAGHHDHRPASGAAQRQTGEIRRRALPAHRS